MALNHVIATGTKPWMQSTLYSLICTTSITAPVVTVSNVVPYTDVIASGDSTLVSALPNYYNYPLSTSASRNYYVDVSVGATDVLVFTSPAGTNVSVNSITIQNTFAGSNACAYYASPDGGVTKYCIYSIAVGSSTCLSLTTQGWTSPPGWSFYVRSATAGTRWVINVIDFASASSVLLPLIYTGPPSLGVNIMYTVPPGYRATFVSTGGYVWTGFGRLQITTVGGGNCTCSMGIRNASGDWALQQATSVGAITAPVSLGNLAGVLEAGDQLFLDVTFNPPTLSVWWVLLALFPTGMIPS